LGLKFPKFSHLKSHARPSRTALGPQVKPDEDKCEYDRALCGYSQGDRQCGLFGDSQPFRAGITLDKLWYYIYIRVYLSPICFFSLLFRYLSSTIWHLTLRIKLNFYFVKFMPSIQPEYRQLAIENTLLLCFYSCSQH
jgi:hypothetical protein